MKENDIEDMFKQKFEDFEPEVDSKVWKNVKTGIKVAGAGVVGKFLINKLGTNALIAIVSSIATVIGTVAIMNWTGGKEKQEPIAEKSGVLVAPPKQLTPEEIKEFLKTEEGISATKAIIDEEKVTTSKPENKAPSQKTIKTLKPKSIASIQASTTNGIAPLIVDVSNIGKGKKNTWMLGDKKNMSESPAYFFDVPGIYTIKLVSENAEGQSQIDSIRVEVLAKSEADIGAKLLSPNGDGKNDFFTVNPQNILKLDAQIIDKEGNLIYKWSGADGGWDGYNMKHEEAPAGTYYYILNTVDLKGEKAENKGTVKLIRQK